MPFAHEQEERTGEGKGDATGEQRIHPEAFHPQPSAFGNHPDHHGGSGDEEISGEGTGERSDPSCVDEFTEARSFTGFPDVPKDVIPWNDEAGYGAQQVGPGEKG